MEVDWPCTETLTRENSSLSSPTTPQSKVVEPILFILNWACWSLVSFNTSWIIHCCESNYDGKQLEADTAGTALYGGNVYKI